MIKKALLVGINYVDTPYQLNGCINDVKNMRSFLTDNCKFSSSNIQLLSDEEEEETKKPTKLNMENGIQWLVTDNLPGDILVLHYSGHGGNIIDRTKDESDVMDETILPVDFETTGQITDDWLYENLVCKVPKDVTLWCFLDSCHSGTAIDLKHNYQSNCKYKKSNIIPENLIYKKEEWTDNFSYSFEKSKESIFGNVCLFSGCQDKETSADAFINSSGQGAFTFCLLETLKSNLQENTLRYKNGVLKLKSILKEINCRLDCKGFTQNTQVSLSKRINFDLTLNL
jgi:hypothetical protein